MNGDVKSFERMHTPAWDEDFDCSIASGCGTDSDAKFCDGTIFGRATGGIDAGDGATEGELEFCIDGGRGTGDEFEGAEREIQSFMR